MKFVRPKRAVTRVFIHCSASDAAWLEGPALVEVVHRWHVVERGWRAVGYHYLIDKRGAVMGGRSLEWTPAAQRGHNAATIAIMVHGEEAFSGESMEALQRLCRGIDDAYGGTVTFHGHREVSAKRCPVFDYRTVLRLDDEGRMIPSVGEDDGRD